MRTMLKGFVAISLVGTAFVGGFSGEKLVRGVGQPERAISEARSGPAQLLARIEKLTRPASASADDPASLSPAETFASVQATIQRDFASPPADAKSAKEWPSRLKYAAIKGMLLAVGDRYTTYFTPDEYKKSMEDVRGQFGGIGASLDVTKKKEVLIVEPIEKSPAERAGIKPGDIIDLVDGKPTYLKPTDTLNDVIGRIRGEIGTTVTLTIRREKVAKPLVIKITRDLVSSPVVSQYMLDPKSKIGYIRLEQFTEDAAQLFDRNLTRLEGQGMKALVFDLRSNPGGLLPVAIEMASRFIESGNVLWIKEKNGDMHPMEVDPSVNTRLHRGKYPVVLLVNGGSASASEIVAGAIQDSGAGFLVGTRTFGKGLVQTIYPLADGEGAVKITTQHYFTRDKHDINLKRDEAGVPAAGVGGVKPDLVIEQTEKDLKAQRTVLLENATNPARRLLAFAHDPQIQKSVALLKDRLAGKPFPESEKLKPDAVKPTPDPAAGFDGGE